MRRSRFIAWIAFLLPAVCAALSVALDAEGRAGEAPLRRPVVITVHGMVDAGLQYSIERRCRQAIAGGADLILFDVDSYGGLLDEALQTADFVSSLKGPTKVAYVSRKAISAAALFCVSCDHIVMREGTTLGDCEPLVPTPEGRLETAGEKVQTVLRAAFRTYAEKNHYPSALVQAMVSKEWEVVRVTSLDGKETRFLRAEDWREMGDEEKKKWQPPKTVVKKGELLTVHAGEALEYGLARHVVATREEALSLYAPGAAAGISEPTWSEETVRLLNTPGATSLLLLGGLLALYLSFKMPGIGAPEAAAAVCLGLLFFSRNLVGLAGTVDAAIALLGLGLLAVEIFVIPGFGVVGVAGIALLLAGVVLMSQRFVIPRVPGEAALFLANVASVLLAAVGSVAAFFILVRFMPQLPGLRRLVLVSAEKAEEGYVAAEVGERRLLGVVGTAASHLRPAGRAELGGHVVDVVSQGDYIERGEKVKVIEVRGNRVVVARAAEWP